MDLYALLAGVYFWETTALDYFVTVCVFNLG